MRLTQLIAVSPGQPLTTLVCRTCAAAHNCRLCKSLREGTALDAGRRWVVTHPGSVRGPSADYSQRMAGRSLVETFLEVL